MKEIFLDIFKGMLIGVANVIPGVSGGTLAVSTGIYEKIINAINNFKKEFKQSIKTLWPIVLGIIIGIVGLAFIITFLLERYTVPTSALFIGLCLGGVPTLYGRIKDEKLKYTHIISFIITLAIIIIPTIIAINTQSISSIEMSFIDVIILFGLGITSAAAMVVPGVSGSMILMMVGYYNIIISTIKETVSTLIHFEMQDFLGHFLIMLPFGLGVLFGIIAISKIIAYILKKWPNASIWGILGLVVASPFAIIIKTGVVFTDIWVILASIITFSLGFFLTYKLGEK